MITQDEALVAHYAVASLGWILPERRRELYVSQSQLARQLLMSKSTIARIEQGGVCSSWAVLDLLAWVASERREPSDVEVVRRRHLAAVTQAHKTGRHLRDLGAIGASASDVPALVAEIIDLRWQVEVLDAHLETLLRRQSDARRGLHRPPSQPSAPSPADQAALTPPLDDGHPTA